MADTDDALKHFMTSSDDPYTLLDLPNGPASSEKEIRGAWKKTALIYHPDKLRAASKDSAFDEAEATRVYILRQDAYGILSEPHLREQYDNALRAKEQKRQRDAALSGKKRAMKEELERRENAAGKRKREDEGDYDERELERIRLDGLRRRKQRAEKLRREAEEEEEAERNRREGEQDNAKQTNGQTKGAAEVQDIDRVVNVRFPLNSGTEHVTPTAISTLFSRFGPIEAAFSKDKKTKRDGEKHKTLYRNISLSFASIRGAHAAVSDFADVAASEGGEWQYLERPEWAAGQAPAILGTAPESGQNGAAPQPPPAPPSAGMADDVLMVRLKEAEKKRRVEKARREREAEIGNGDAVDWTKGGTGRRPMPGFKSFRGGAGKVANGGEEVEKRREVERRRLEEDLRRHEAEEGP